MPSGTCAARPGPSRGSARSPAGSTTPSVAFALVANGEAPTAQTAQDQLVLALLGYPERPPVDDLAPR